MSSRNFTETVFICSPYRLASTELLEKAEGMVEELAYASELGILIRMMRDSAEGERRLMEAIFGKEAISGSDKKNITESGEEAEESENEE